MKLGRTARIVVGLVTLFSWILPLAVAGLWFGGALLMIPLAVMAEGAGPGGGDFPVWLAVLFPLLWFATMLVFFLTVLLSVALRIFYHIHVTLNRTASDFFRVAVTIGLFFLPFIAEPLYYYAAIWRDDPPDWAARPVDAAVR